MFSLPRFMMDWIEGKVMGLQNERLKTIVIMLAITAQKHPYKSAFAIIMLLFCLGPLSLFLGFVLISTVLLLSGTLIVEFLIISAGLFFLIPVLLFSALISIASSATLFLVKTVLLKTDSSNTPDREHRRKKRRHDDRKEREVDFANSKVQVKETQTPNRERRIPGVEELVDFDDKEM